MYTVCMCALYLHYNNVHYIVHVVYYYNIENLKFVVLTLIPK